MKKILSLIDLRFTHLSLSIARIAFFLVNTVELGQLYYWRQICFYDSSSVQFLNMQMSIPNLLLPTAIIVQIFLVFGFFTKTCSLANYLLLMNIFRHTPVHYHYDFLMMNFAFIFLFAPKPRCLSIDSLIRSKRLPNQIQSFVPPWFGLLYFLGIELTYFDSLFFKYSDITWTQGFSFWLPSSIPLFSSGVMPDFAENLILMKFLSYSSLAFETLFPLILIRKLRLIFFAMGFGLHMGIAIFFPIPLFGIGMCTLYLFFFDWEALLRLFKIKSHKANPSELKEANPTVRNALGYGIVITMLLSQCVLTFGNFISPRFNAMKEKNKLLVTSMGLSRHPLYLTAHYKVAAPIFRWKTVVDQKVIEAPTFDEKGYPRYPHNTGRFWALNFWNMRLNKLSLDQLSRVWTSYLIGWFKHNNLPISPVKLYYKDMRVNFVWDFKIDNELEKRPWKHGATITITDATNYQSKIDYDPEFLSFMTYERTGKIAPIQGK